MHRTETLTFIIATFAVYRLAWLVANDEGPFSIFSRLRGRVDPKQRTWVGRGLNCPICVSFWVALAFSWLGGDSWLLWWFGLAGSSLFLTRYAR